MSDYDDVWLIVPVYNEAQVIREVVQNARLTFPNIVCVDDGSRDASVSEIRQSGAHLVRHPVNLGQGASLQTGIEYARTQPGAKYFVTFDADGQHRVEDVVRMIDRLRKEPVDILVGTRFHGDTSHIPWIKRLVLKTVVALSPRTRRLKLTDAHNGLRAFNKTVADGLDITINGMGHASEIIAIIDRKSWRVAEEKVTIIYTEYSMAKGQSLINGVNILFDSALRGSRR
ncbi:glycosyltransferase family 2 protein [Actinoalloteichus hymeniacidonis]|uniref:Glycosyl transferase family 2 n=1 Tax=Actinoalloteichus hymeniacidonis TaxID=340345 RepID=A0AAC9HKI9_9PSEU|nr:glycosyltransferase family 2 protein [Actinoalloteichus hymeniacidonis]AOS60983.1 Glycosyl transferase family 2 [Actinoalloteichus hymeniacidonis]MBB5911017.1 glycosyltransferase involved in cell wall biosynthesis [Actinoalloteichus hymeniacidonis]